ncbi:MAG: sugar ABC transporter permease [Chloroflexi bacterium]|nr:sugar ABC transporter permease [Chloroflexota bacterium]
MGGFRIGGKGRKRTRGVGHQAPHWSIIALFILPAFLLYTVFMVWPLFQSLYFSLFEFKGLARGSFVGLRNFRELLTRYPLNEQLPRAFLHNVYFFIGTMLVQNTMGLLLARLLYAPRWGKRFFQVVYTMPYLISALVVGYLWSLMLNPLFGPINYILRAVGLGSWARPWLGDPHTALTAIILVNAWQWVGFPMLLFSAGLTNISDEIREAARIDGATSWRLFFHIELPLLLPVIGIVTVLTFIGNFNVFGIVWAMGGVNGEPAGSTDVLGLVFYRTAFRGGVDAFGLASALAVLMFIFIFGVSLFMLGRFRKWEEHLT